MNFTKLKKYCEIVALLDDTEKDTELYFALLSALKNVIDKELQIREDEINFSLNANCEANDDIIFYDGMSETLV